MQAAQLGGANLHPSAGSGGGDDGRDAQSIQGSMAAHEADMRACHARREIQFLD
jgi:hypothetical protein